MDTKEPTIQEAFDKERDIKAAERVKLINDLTKEQRPYYEDICREEQKKIEAKKKELEEKKREIIENAKRRYIADTPKRIYTPQGARRESKTEEKAQRFADQEYQRKRSEALQNAERAALEKTDGYLKQAEKERRQAIEGTEHEKTAEQKLSDLALKHLDEKRAHEEWADLERDKLEREIENTHHLKETRMKLEQAEQALKELRDKDPRLSRFFMKQEQDARAERNGLEKTLKNSQWRAEERRDALQIEIAGKRGEMEKAHKSELKALEQELGISRPVSEHDLSHNSHERSSSDDGSRSQEAGPDRGDDFSKGR